MDLDTFADSRSQERPWGGLLDIGYKIIRDCVYEDDIQLTSTETKIIDLPEFQRLQFIRQLGPAYLLYRTANHTRFEHSLGTLYMAEQIIEAINANSPRKVGPRDRFLTRILALIHDVAHVPFGHLLEDESGLFEYKQWQSPIRQQSFLGPIQRVVREAVENAFKKVGQDGKSEADQLTRDLEEAVTTERLSNGSNSFIPDIVSNTISADLLDYAVRDGFYTGFPQRYDRRILSYFTVDDVQSGATKGTARRIVIRLYKTTKRLQVRNDVLTGLVELLNLRSNLGERVYFHHTRREASAMIVKMVAAGMKSTLLDERILCDLGDDTLVSLLLTATGEKMTDEQRGHLGTASKLAKDLVQRRLYKPVFELSFYNESIKQKLEDLQNWERKYDFERTLAELAEISDSNVVVYLPKRKMGHKTAEALVKISPTSKIMTLEEFAKSNFEVGEEYARMQARLRANLEALAQESSSLWRLSVFASPDVDEGVRQTINAICESWFLTSTPVVIAQLLAEKQNRKLPPKKLVELAQGVKTFPLSSSRRESLLTDFVRQVRDAIGSSS